jgi:cell division septation protein DedD
MKSPARLPRFFPLSLFSFALLTANAPVMAVSADSLRQEVSRLASQGRLDEALDQVGKNADALPGSWNAMFRGKLELDGDKSARGYKAASTDSAPPQMRGEALFRQGQYQYAAGRYNLAIPPFREYLARYPTGAWSEASAYWMAYSCIQLVRLKPGKDAYLDSAQAYLRKLEFRGRTGYYWPLARAAQGRVLLLRGDTVGAQRALRDARGKAPAEEVPGVLLLSLQTENSTGARSASAGQWEDSLRWGYPLSPETKLLGTPARPRAVAAPVVVPPVVQPAPAPQPVNTAKTAPQTSSGSWSLQLGVFSQPENARKFVKELAAKKITARIETMPGRTAPLHRVLYGAFATEAVAAADGKRLLRPKGYEFRVVEP